MSNLDAWRENRERGWQHDIGYQLQDVLRGHHYDYKNKGSKPDDPGWHVCSCGTWEGYWSSFEPHVANHLRALVEDQLFTAFRSGFFTGGGDPWVERELLEKWFEARRKDSQ